MMQRDAEKIWIQKRQQPTYMVPECPSISEKKRGKVSALQSTDRQELREIAMEGSTDVEGFIDKYFNVLPLISVPS